MKTKLSLCLSLFLVVIACEKEDIVEDEEFRISIIIENDYKISDHTIDFLIHNSQGELIDKIKDISNRSSYDLVVPEDVQSVYFTVVHDYNTSSNFFRIKSFILKESIEIILGQYEGRNIEEERFEIDFEGEKVRSVNSNSSLIGNGKKVSLEPLFFPHDEIFMCKIGEEELLRVVNIPDAKPSETYLFSSLDRTEVVDSIEFEINEEDYIYSYLYGKRTGIDDYFTSLSDVDEPKDNIIKHYLPLEGMTDFLLWNWIDQVNFGGGFGSYTLYFEFDTQIGYKRPEIDLDVKHVDLKSVELSSTNGQFFNTQLRPNVSNNYSIDWEIYGEIDQNVDFVIPNIDDHMMEVESNYLPNNFKNWSTTIFKADQDWTYEDFILFRLESFTQFNIPNSMEYKWKNHF